MSNLTGHWLGVYWQHGQPTEFDMEVTDLGGVISGVIQDQGPLGLRATFSGDHSDCAIRFEKKYLYLRCYIDYQGNVSSNGLAMSGQWSIRSDSGVGWSDRGLWQAEKTGRSIGLEDTTAEEETTPGIPARSPETQLCHRRHFEA